jgi:hypothetical protein
LKKQLRRGPRWKQKLGVVEELGQVSRIARKRTIVAAAVVGPHLQAAILYSGSSRTTFASSNFIYL